MAFDLANVRFGDFSGSDRVPLIGLTSSSKTPLSFHPLMDRVSSFVFDCRPRDDSCVPQDVARQMPTSRSRTGTPCSRDLGRTLLPRETPLRLPPSAWISRDALFGDRVCQFVRGMDSLDPGEVCL